MSSNYQCLQQLHIQERLVGLTNEPLYYVTLVKYFDWNLEPFPLSSGSIAYKCTISANDTLKNKKNFRIEVEDKTSFIVSEDDAKEICRLANKPWLFDGKSQSEEGCGFSCGS